MEAVRIICLLSESQLRGLVDRVSSLLSPRIDEVSDIDELMLMDSVRVCVDFDVDLKPAVNYHALARMTNLKYHVIQRMISRITQDVKSHSIFSMRRQQLVRA